MHWFETFLPFLQSYIHHFDFLENPALLTFRSVSLLVIRLCKEMMSWLLKARSWWKLPSLFCCFPINLLLCFGFLIKKVKGLFGSSYSKLQMRTPLYLKEVNFAVAILKNYLKNEVMLSLQSKWFPDGGTNTICGVIG